MGIIKLTSLSGQPVSIDARLVASVSQDTWYDDSAGEQRVGSRVHLFRPALDVNSDSLRYVKRVREEPGVVEAAMADKTDTTDKTDKTDNDQLMLLAQRIEALENELASYRDTIERCASEHNSADMQDSAFF